MNMDFYERFRKQSEKNQQAHIQSLSKIGDPNEIISYIAAMPVLCEEGRGIFNVSYEVRIDHRFLVICQGKCICIYPAEAIQSFSVSASDSLPDACAYYFCINYRMQFHVPSDCAYSLYSRLKAMCPNFFSPIAYTQPINLTCGILSISEGNIIIKSMTLFRKWKIKATIPVRDIKCCYQTYFDDSEVHWDQLVLLMHDGTKYEIQDMHMTTILPLAQLLKSQNPNLEYCFPRGSVLHGSITKKIY